MKKLGITTDCVCDLPEDFLKANDVGIVYFYITTDTGSFSDGYAITSENLLEYLEEGGVKAETFAPSAEEYRDFYEESLKQFDEIIHIAISSQIGISYGNAQSAVKLMGENGRRVTVIDSQHLSTGMGHMVLKAVEMRDSGSSATEIAEALNAMRDRISSTFITQNADHLYRNGRVSKFVKKLTGFLWIHPVLGIKKGRMVLKTVRIGQYEDAAMRYVRGELKRSAQIDRRRLFITHAGCSVKMIAQIKAEAERLCKFDEMIVTKASATVSSNCGPGTVGVLFVRK